VDNFVDNSGEIVAKRRHEENFKKNRLGDKFNVAIAWRQVV